MQMSGSAQAGQRQMLVFATVGCGWACLWSGLQAPRCPSRAEPTYLEVYTRFARNMRRELMVKQHLGAAFPRVI